MNLSKTAPIAFEIAHYKQSRESNFTWVPNAAGIHMTSSTMNFVSKHDNFTVYSFTDLQQFIRIIAWCLKQYSQPSMLYFYATCKTVVTLRFNAELAIYGILQTTRW